MLSSALINTSHPDLESFDFPLSVSVGLEQSGKSTDTGEEDALSSKHALLEFRCFCPMLSTNQTILYDDSYSFSLFGNSRKY